MIASLLRTSAARPLSSCPLKVFAVLAVDRQRRVAQDVGLIGERLTADVVYHWQMSSSWMLKRSACADDYPESLS